MGAVDILNLAIGLLTTAFGAAKNAGLVGNPDWVKYADAGLFIATKLSKILPDVYANPTKYDKMTPEQIIADLTPATWDEIEARALAELGRAGAHTPPPTT
jgi:hypothetical protein